MSDRTLIINELKNTGLDTSLPVIEPKDYQRGEVTIGRATPLGASVELFKDGHGWLDYAPKGEMQFNRNFDSFSCVIFSIAKALVYYLKVRYNIEVTISEMYNAYFAEVVPGRGTSIRKGLESFRNWGWVDDSDYPFIAKTTQAEYFKKPPQYLIIKGKEQLKVWKINWEAIPTTNAAIIDALKRTPVVLTGFAWASYYGEGVYYDNGNPANHAFLGVDYYPNGNIIVDDSYPRDFSFDENSPKDEFIKQLDKYFKYGSAHTVWLEKVSNVSLLDKIMRMFNKISRDAHGGFHFIKDNKRQAIDNWQAAFAAIIDEVGVKNNNLTDEQLAKIPTFQFFGK